MAKALGIKQEITSPTYIIAREYKLKKNFAKFVHMDIYKLMEGKEIWDVGLAEMLKEKNLIVIEWAEKISQILKEQSKKAFIVWINMYHKSESERIIEYGEFE